MRTNASERKRSNDSGQTWIDTMAAIGIGIVVATGLFVLYQNVNQNQHEATAIADAKTSISDTLNRTSQALQVANPVLVANPGELVIERKDAAGAITRTRWYKSGTTLYQQFWTGVSKDYPGGAAWISPTTTTAAAPNGDGTQTSSVALSDVTSAVLYNYVDKNGVTLAAPGVDPAKISTVSRVDISLQTNAYSGKTSPVTSGTKVALRNGAGAPSDNNSVAAAIQCPAATFDPASTVTPKLNWSVLPGVTNYEIRRNDIAVTTVTVAAPQTTGTWTDPAAPTGSVIEYQVLGKNASGTLSQSCSTVTWRVQVATPVFKNTTVLPGGTEASAWSTAPDNVLDHPRVALNWTASTGATSYQLFYRVLDANGNPTSAAFKPLTGTLSPGTTSYAWDGASWAAWYEFYVEATAKNAGSSPSRHIQIRTHPKTPDNVVVSPAYGTGADKTVNGLNNLSWSASASASRYEVWRYDSGTSGTSSLAGTTTTTAFSDTVPYGSTYTYYVVAKNYGPRGTDATGADVTTFRSSPNPESQVDNTSTQAVGVSYNDHGNAGTTNGSGVYYGKAAVASTRALVATATRPAGSAMPMTATQLQYPPIPVVNAATTKDLDGTNQLDWSAAKSATGYQVTRFSVSGDTFACLTAPGTDCKAVSNAKTTATIWSDPAAPGSRFVYGVLAFNATGSSVAPSADATLTQRPAAPPLNVTQAPTRTSSNANFSSTQNADAGNSAANKFCTIQDCKYELLRNGVHVTDAVHQQSGGPLVWTNAPNPDGDTLTWTVRAKNNATFNGGWSDTTAKIVNTYPGQFGVTRILGDAYGNHIQRFMALLKNTTVNESSVTVMDAGYSTVFWKDPAGKSVTVRVQRTGGADEDLGPDSTYKMPTSHTIDVTFNSSVNNYQSYASPGTSYAYVLTAQAANGLTRQVTPDVLYTPPDISRHATTIVTCAGPSTSQYHSARLQDFQHAPKWGSYVSTNVKGLTWYTKAATLPSVTWNGNYTTADGDGIANNGIAYYQGLRNGFDITTIGLHSLNSVTVRQIIDSEATFNSGCAPAGSSGWNLVEPDFPCYGYSTADPTCYAVNPGNRPQFWAK